jgi:ribosome-binding protein aMBF1 (putative translation factor)
MAKINFDVSQLSDETVRRILADIIGADDEGRIPEARVNRETVASVARDAAQAGRDAADEAVAPARRKRGRRTMNPQRYRVQFRDLDSDDVMTPEVAATYDAMVKASKRGDGWLTEAECIAARGRTDSSALKAAQSAIHWLKSHDKTGRALASGDNGGKRAIVATEK